MFVVHGVKLSTVRVHLSWSSLLCSIDRLYVGLIYVRFSLSSFNYFTSVVCGVMVGGNLLFIMCWFNFHLLFMVLHLSSHMILIWIQCRVANDSVRVQQSKVLLYQLCVTLLKNQFVFS
jgi:hypothetical protein